MLGGVILRRLRSLPQLLPTLYQAGASVVNEEGTAANFNNDAGAALQFWVDLYHKYQVAPLDVTQPLEAFVSAQVL